jgi:hypothetical protein
MAFELGAPASRLEIEIRKRELMYSRKKEGRRRDPQEEAQ